MSEQTKKTSKRIVAATEAELRAHECPAKKKAYRVSVGDKVAFTYAGGTGSAVVFTAKSLGVVATRLDKVPTPDKVFADLQALPPEQLRELVARLNVNGQVPPAQPEAPPAEKPAGKRK